MSNYFEDDNDTTQNDDIHVDITANIEFQLNKFDDNDYLKHKFIPETALFANKQIIQSLKTFYEHNSDIPLIICGKKGIGKITCIIGLLGYISCYSPDIPIKDKINNIRYFKVYDLLSPKLLYYENIYFLNIKILHNNTEINNYLEYIYKITKSRNFDENEKKIMIISNIDLCSKDTQRYITFMIDKIGAHISYIFTTTTLTLIDTKITSSCSFINFKALKEEEFTKTFKTNFKKLFSIKENNKIILNNSIVKQFYNIYVSNNYNIGTTIAQIKYHIDIDGIDFLKDKQNTLSLLSLIAKKFIKKKLIISTIDTTLEIRNVLYILVSLNINLIIFVKEVIKQLYNSKLNTTIKYKIMDETHILINEICKSNKEVILVETFFYKIINIIYSRK